MKKGESSDLKIHGFILVQFWYRWKEETQDFYKKRSNAQFPTKIFFRDARGLAPLISEAIGFFVVVWEFLMAGFNFDNGGRRCIRPILEKYQQGKSQYKIRPVSVFLFSQGESDGYTVETKEENFTISSYPLEQTEFLYGQKQGK